VIQIRGRIESVKYGDPAALPFHLAESV